MPYNYYTNQYMPAGYQYYPTQRPQENYQPMYNRQPALLGKTVDNIEVVKAIDIPLDGSTSYFPMADGSAIASKQLQQDGTSRIIIYKPVEQEKTEEKYITQSDIKAQFGDFNPKDIKDIKDELKTLKKQFREIQDDLEEKRGE